MIDNQGISLFRDRNLMLLLLLAALAILLLPFSLFYGSWPEFLGFASAGLLMAAVAWVVGRQQRWASIIVGCGYMIFAHAVDAAIPGQLVAEFSLFVLLAFLVYARDPWVIAIATVYHLLEVWLVPYSALHLETLQQANGVFFVCEAIVLGWMSWIMQQDEANMAENERYFRGIFESATEAMAVFDSKGQYHAVNAAWEKLTGYSRQEALSSEFSPALFIENFDLQRFLMQINQKDELRLERRFRHKDSGALSEVLSSVRKLPKEASWARDRYVLVDSDITAFRAKEKEIAELRAHWQEIFEAAGEAIAVACEEENIVKIKEVNQAFCNLLGYSKEDLTAEGFDVRHITPPDWLEKEQRLLQEMAQKGKEIRYEKPHLRKDGTIVPTLVTVRPLPKPGWMVTTLADLTEIKKAQEEVAAKERYWRGIFTSAGAGIMISNANGDVLDMNPALADILGYDYPVPPQKDFIRQIVPPEALPSVMQGIRKAYETKETVIIETKYRRRDGTLVPVILSRRAFDHRFHVVTVMDATELQRQRHEIELLSMLQKGVIDAVAATLTALADGRFDVTLDDEIFSGEFARFKEVLGDFGLRLKNILFSLRQTSETVLRAAVEIASGSENLSKRVEKQAAALEELSASMEEMSVSIEETARQAEEAKSLAELMHAKARLGQSNIDSLFETIQIITQGSGEIETMLELINEFAFQTNLLALNASVEAARAGQYGSGFGVIAEEIRRLAQKSAASAKEVGSKILSIHQAIDKGEGEVSSLRTTYMEILDTVSKTAKAVTTIADANREEAKAIHQVNNALVDFQHVSQQDASLIEQNTTAAASLRDQANELNRLAEFGRHKADMQLTKAPVSNSNVGTPAVLRLLPEKNKGDQEEWESF